MISRVRGTDDVLDLRLYNFVLNQIKKHLELHNFSEIDTPILEHTNLFVHSVGEQTDIVSKEMYVFKREDDEDSICLRPEATSSVIRAYVENSVEQRPWKVYVHGPMFRKERPQKGRWRQFNQTSIEILNASAIEQDAQLIKMLDSLLIEVFKLENYALKLNFLGCSKDRKKHREELVGFLNKNQADLCPICNERKDRNPLRVFDCKIGKCQQILVNAPKIIEYLCPECNNDWEILKNLLHILSVSYVVDHNLVRGLDYYNKTVFEFVSRDLGAQSTFIGGGRYSLGKSIGSKEDIDSVGVGIGMGRLCMLAEKYQNKLSIPEKPALHIIIPISREQKPLALLLANMLRENSIAHDLVLEDISVTNMMKKANKLGAKFVLIVGENEQKDGTVAVKNMQNGNSVIIKQTELGSYLKTGK
jgi:histidyl-tRNA synthetase